MYAASIVESSATVTVTARTKLFEGDYDWNDDDADYDVAANGKDFVMVRYPARNTRIVVTVNWADALRRKLKAAR